MKAYGLFVMNIPLRLAIVYLINTYDIINTTPNKHNPLKTDKTTDIFSIAGEVIIDSYGTMLYHSSSVIESSTLRENVWKNGVY